MASSVKLRGAVDGALRRRCSLSLSEKELLMLLRNRGGRSRMADISGGLRLSTGGATKMVGRLVKAELVSRGKSAEDQRVVEVTLTEEGKARLDAAMPVMLAVVREQLAPLTATEVNQLNAIMEKLNG